MRVHLVRHGECDGTGAVLHGRAAGVALNRAGRRQAVRTARRLADEPLAAIYTSPVERAQETAGIIAALHDLTPITHDGFIEIDYGDWTGRDLRELDGDEHWRAYNVSRSTTAPPRGEHPLAVQSRAVEALEVLRRMHADERIVVVSHADVIRAVVASVLGFSLENSLRLEIAPASVTMLQLNEGWPQVLSLGTR